MDSVFILWHEREIGGDTDSKFIGVYRTRDEAEAARCRLKDKPGFREMPQGFEIHEYVLGRDGWSEGFVSQAEAMQFEA